ncbi:zf-TFIIB domain-containing protein [Actinotalea subterranea]|uniref:TFIIB-type zinc ribbon-containing protein n=1 Tax=Actinotalea subterranea TaxID=2607497 RepID=UPI0011EBD569|nr:zf-TFIIB domain-containing protein [Actinotalea subterranea]
MKCPIDDAELVMSERQGVEIDYCPTCRGVWLDRGELDKILDRAATAPGPGAATGPAPVAPAPAPAAAFPPAPDPRTYRPAPAPEPYREPRREGYPDQYRDGYREPRREGYPDQYRDGRPYKKRKESWLSDILDFG